MFTLSRLLILGAACLPCVFGGPILDRRTSAQLQSPLLSDHPASNKDRPLPPPPQQLHEIPPHLRSQSAPRINTPDFVILQFESSGGFPGTSVALPLRRRISPYDIQELPLYPRAASILATSGRPHVQPQATGSIIDRIVCLVHPLVDVDEMGRDFRRYKSLDSNGEWSLWFRHRDGMVDFENSDERWFLGGRPVESYECY